MGPEQGPRPRLLKPLIPQGYYQRPKRLRVARVQPSQAARSAASSPHPLTPQGTQAPAGWPRGAPQSHTATARADARVHPQSASGTPPGSDGGLPPYPHAPSPHSFRCPWQGSLATETRTWEPERLPWTSKPTSVSSVKEGRRIWPGGSAGNTGPQQALTYCWTNKRAQDLKSEAGLELDPAPCLVTHPFLCPQQWPAPPCTKPPYQTPGTV